MGVDVILHAFAVKDEEMQDAGASQIAPDSPGVFRSLRRRPQPNYAQAAGMHPSTSPPVIILNTHPLQLEALGVSDR